MSQTAQSETPTSIVVGGMHGLARNVAQMFHDAGHRVVIVDRRDKPDGDYPPFYDLAIGGDLLDAAERTEIVERVAEACPTIRNIVFSLRYRGPEEDEWRAEFDLGLTVPKVFMERLGANFPPGGAAVMISSTAAHKVTAGLPVSYHAIKAGLEHMTRFYAVELGHKHGIRVNGIAPGYMVKDESLHFFLDQKERVAAVSDRHPVGRFGRADDIANAAFFLCSDEASFITGQILTVDGGLSLENPGYEV